MKGTFKGIDKLLNPIHFFPKHKKLDNFGVFVLNSMIFVCLFIYLFLLFRATPVAYGGSQASGLIEATTASLHHSHSNTRPYTTDHSNAESLTN